jgi:Na+-translocating ferredoxin:NAD+ oxidoreductase RnfG subunit
VTSEQKRRAELDKLGGDIQQARRSGATLTARVVFENAAKAAEAAGKLRSTGWGASLDGRTVRALVVVA